MLVVVKVLLFGDSWSCVFFGAAVSTVALFVFLGRRFVLKFFIMIQKYYNQESKL